MINTIREGIFAWTLKHQATRTVVMPTWDEVRSIAVLYPTDDIQHLIKKMEVSKYQKHYNHIWVEKQLLKQKNNFYSFFFFYYFIYFLIFTNLFLL